MTTLYLVRHGESTWNGDRRLQGQADPPLSLEGRNQARALGRTLEGIAFDRIVSSDLQRTRQTVDLLGYDRPVLEPNLREIHVGDWQGRPIADLIAADGPAYTGWRRGTHTPPGGEPWTDFCRRIGAALDGLLDGADARVLVVTHGGVIRAVMQSVVGLDLTRIEAVAPASVTLVTTTPTPRLIAYNAGIAISGAVHNQAL